LNRGLDVLWLNATVPIEIIEWPVALVVGAGTFIAERMARQEANKTAAQG
jgi:hypothetical protein